jgi:hypothetical protein
VDEKEHPATHDQDSRSVLTGGDKQCSAGAGIGSRSSLVAAAAAPEWREKMD